MKPNKQKIFSAQPNKPGYSQTKSKRRQSIASSCQEFELNSITKNLHVKSSSFPFKLLSFSEKTTSIQTCRTSKESNSNPRKSQSPQKRLSNSEDLNTATIDSITYPKEATESYIRTFPNKFWCKSCKKEVFSRVRLGVPKVNMWEKMCCNQCLMADKFQEILHFCPHCEKVLENFQPRVYNN